MKKITLVFSFLIACTVTAQTTIFTDDFEAETIDATTYTKWVATDQDADGNNWEVADIGAFAATNAVNHPMQTLAADSDSWEGAPFMPNNYLTTAMPLDLTNYESTMLTFTMGTYQVNGTFTNDQYSVYVTTSNVIADIDAATPITTRLVGDDAPSDQADGSASAATLSFDISAFDGQMVYLTFRHYNSVDVNSVLIDDVLVEATLLSNDEFDINAFKHFYNPDNDILRLESANSPIDNIQIFNVLGQEIMNRQLSSATELINMSTFVNGIYLAKVSVNGNSKTIKILKQ